MWAEISLADILHNLKVIRGHVGARRKILAVVKANAYGLGSVPISKALAKAGAEWLGVTCSSEGIELREAGIRKRILVLTGFWAGEEEIILRHDLTPTITRLEQLRQLERAAARVARRKKSFRARFHLKINTGMNRLGIEAGEVDAFAAELGRCPHLLLEGTYTHFASAEDFTSDQTSRQERKFFAALERLRGLGVSPGLVHLANSGAICARPSTWGDLVRPGAILYGYHQGFDPPEKKAEVMAEMDLRPCLSLRARIISLRDVAAGEGVGYGARFVTARASRIAVIAAGYADGLCVAHESRIGAFARAARAVGGHDLDGSGDCGRYGSARCSGGRYCDDLWQRWGRSDRSFRCGARDRHGDFGFIVRARPARAAILYLLIPLQSVSSALGVTPNIHQWISGDPGA